MKGNLTKTVCSIVCLLGVGWSQPLVADEFSLQGVGIVLKGSLTLVQGEQLALVSVLMGSRTGVLTHRLMKMQLSMWGPEFKASLEAGFVIFLGSDMYVEDFDNGCAIAHGIGGSIIDNQWAVLPSMMFGWCGTGWSIQGARLSNGKGTIVCLSRIAGAAAGVGVVEHGLIQTVYGDPRRMNRLSEFFKRRGKWVKVPQK